MAKPGSVPTARSTLVTPSCVSGLDVSARMPSGAPSTVNVTSPAYPPTRETFTTVRTASPCGRSSSLGPDGERERRRRRRRDRAPTLGMPSSPREPPHRSHAARISYGTTPVMSKMSICCCARIARGEDVGSAIDHGDLPGVQPNADGIPTRQDRLERIGAVEDIQSIPGSALSGHHQRLAVGRHGDVAHGRNIRNDQRVRQCGDAIRVE